MFEFLKLGEWKFGNGVNPVEAGWLAWYTHVKKAHMGSNPISNFGYGRNWED